MRFVLSVGVVWGLVWWLNDASAQDLKPSPPKGLRVMFNGNSWFNFVPGGVADQVKAAGIEGQGSMASGGVRCLA